MTAVIIAIGVGIIIPMAYVVVDNTIAAITMVIYIVTFIDSIDMTTLFIVVDDNRHPRHAGRHHCYRHRHHYVVCIRRRRQHPHH